MFGTLNLVPRGNDFVAIATNRSHNLALRSDGTIAAWGDNSWGQTDVPALPAGVRYVEISAGWNHSVARRSDGAIVVWGDNRYHQNRLPVLAPGQTLTQVTAGGNFTVALYGSGGFETFGRGCAGSSGLIGLRAAEPPQVGQSLTVTFAPPPASSAILLVGVSNTTSTLGPLPRDLASIGMPGCALRVSTDLLLPVAGSPARATLPLPKDATLAGLRLHAQAVILDAAANALGLVLSDAVTAVVGG